MKGGIIALAAGLLAGVAAEQLVVRRPWQPDPYEQENFGQVRGEPHWLRASDGTELYVEVHPCDDPDAPTIVFAHGYCLNQDSWHFQRKAFLGKARMVLWDQRNHGRSERGPLANSTIEQLGRDLQYVLDGFTKGPVVLVGHSMGGMTVLAYAGRYSDDLLARCAAVVLLGTAAADVKRPGWFGKVEMGVMHVAKRGPRIPAGIFVTNPHQRYLNFGDDADPRDVRLVRKAIAGTKIRDMGNYFSALEELDESASMAMLGRLPVTVMVGTKDRLTPPHYARALHEGIEGSRLIEVPGKGHMLGFEATAEVCDVVADHVRADQGRLPA